MKKTYESPKVEKMAFDYSDVVVASNDGCTNTTTFTLSQATSSTCLGQEIGHTQTNLQ